MTLMPHFPDILPVEPLAHAPRLSVRVPGSKSITNRALVLAALSARELPLILRGALQSEDTEVMVAALQQLGFNVFVSWDGDPPALQIDPVTSGRIIPATEASLFIANSGTSMRFLTALVSLGEGTYRLHGVPRMHERPIEDLLQALNQLGVESVSENGNGCPPVRVTTTGWHNSHVAVRGSISSQFLSGLLLAAPFAERETHFSLDGPLVSRPYLDMTLAMLRQWGFRCEEQTGAISVPGQQRSSLREYDIEPDASAASYFFAAAAILRGRITVNGLSADSLQGDARFVDVLEQMGCRVERAASSLTVEGKPLRGVDVDMNGISDTVMTLAAAACFAEGPTTIRNVAHIRHKETDRLRALAIELRRAGAGVEEFADGLRILPAPLHEAAFDTYDDHRMAMSLALLGLRVPGIRIKNPGCVAKTYPHFFADLEKLRCDD